MGLAYVTSDEIGTETGGGVVTKNESDAFMTLGYPSSVCRVWQRKDLDGAGDEPWRYDETALRKCRYLPEILKLTHFYSGTFSKTVNFLKERNCKIAYTIAAHSREVSKREHEKLGFPFPYLHLTDKLLWNRYIDGYRRSDVIVCPGSVPANTVREYGPEFEQKRIEIIPHGCTLPEEVKALPERFVVGYLGCCSGPDKGVVYLVRAWKKLNYKDATLVLAGKDSTSDYMFGLVDREGGGNVHLAGWQKNVSDFYNSISLFVCPATTEGFNLETLESFAHGRAVLCSNAAGAVDLVNESCRFRACDVNDLAEKIDWVKKREDVLQAKYIFRAIASEYTWEKVRQMYVKLWKELL